MDKWLHSNEFIKRSIAIYGYTMFGAMFLWLGLCLGYVILAFAFGFIGGLFGWL